MSATNDKTARVMAVLSLIASIAAVLVPYIQQKSLQEEQLKPELEWRNSGNYEITNIEFGDQGGLVRSEWRVSFSNTGNQKLSITNYKLSQGENPEGMIYTGIDGGLTNERNETVSLPIILENGETKAFVLHVGNLVPTATKNILKHYSKEASIPVQEGDLILARAGVDLFGNRVDLQEFGPSYIITKSYSKTPTYWIEVTTSRSNKFHGSSASSAPPKL